MATEKWIAGTGVGLTWTAAFTASTLDGIVNGNSILSDLAISNASPLDMFCDLSLVFGTGPTWASPFYMGVYLYPLSDDGTHYGDGQFGSQAAGIPGQNYYCGSINTAAATSGAKYGQLTGIVIPPGSFKFVLYNGMGATLAGSGANTCKYRTYNRQVT